MRGYFGSRRFRKSVYIIMGWKIAKQAGISIGVARSKNAKVELVLDGTAMEFRSNWDRKLR